MLNLRSHRKSRIHNELEALLITAIVGMRRKLLSTCAQQNVVEQEVAR